MAASEPMCYNDDIAIGCLGGRKVDIHRRTNEELRRLWFDIINDGQWPLERRLWPLQYGRFDQPALVFVGLNPSYTERELRDCEEREIGDASELLDPASESGPRRKASVPESPYFRPLRELAAGAGLHPVHLDIFAVRETGQDTVLRALTPNGHWSEFALGQWRIFERTLFDLRPEMIVTVNAHASKVLLEQPWVGP